MCIRKQRKILLLTLVAFLTVLIFHQRDNNKDQRRRQPTASLSVTKLSVGYYYKECGYIAIFSQEEVEKICEKPFACDVVRIEHLDQRDFRPAWLNLTGGQAALKVFVHPSKDLISNSIVSSGGWDVNGVDTVLRALRALPGAALVDIGSNLGVFSLQAAHFGRKVVAIDANYQNVIRLHKSVVANGLESRVQIFWNALSTDHGAVRMRLPTDCNIGGGFPTEVLQPHWLRDPIEVRTAGLDDLLLGGGGGYLNGASAIVIKIDIEGYEWSAMATAAGTFNRYLVPLVLMEWRGTQIFHPEKADFLLGFFASRNYTAYNFWNKKPVALKWEEHKNWPGDVLWLSGEAHQLLRALEH